MKTIEVDLSDVSLYSMTLIGEHVDISRLKGRYDLDYKCVLAYPLDGGVRRMEVELSYRLDMDVHISRMVASGDGHIVVSGETRQWWQPWGLPERDEIVAVFVTPSCVHEGDADKHLEKLGVIMLKPWVCRDLPEDGVYIHSYTAIDWYAPDCERKAWQAFREASKGGGCPPEWTTADDPTAIPPDDAAGELWREGVEGKREYGFPPRVGTAVAKSLSGRKLDSAPESTARLLAVYSSCGNQHVILAATAYDHVVVVCRPECFPKLRTREAALRAAGYTPIQWREVTPLN